jgi:hypothetical protein
VVLNTIIYAALVAAAGAAFYCLFTGVSGRPRRWHDRAWRLVVAAGLFSWFVFLFLFGDS